MLRLAVQDASKPVMIIHVETLKAAKRRASGETMKRLIAEEEDRKRLKKDEEEAAKRAQEQAKQEMEERQRRELEERRKALALKKVEVEEKQRQLEVGRTLILADCMYGSETFGHTRVATLGLTRVPGSGRQIRFPQR